MTLNTHSWMEEDAEKKLQQLADQIAEVDYDIIALQEVNQELDSEKTTTDSFFQPLADQADIHQDNFAYVLIEILKEKGLNYYWSWTASHIGYGRYAEGAAILSKAPIAADHFLVSLEDDFADYHTRQILIGKTQLLGQEVRVLSSHYSWWNDEKDSGFAYEWDKTLAYLEQDGSPIILMGDLNNAADVRGEGYDYLKTTAPQLLDAYEEAEERSGSYTVEKSIDGWKENQQPLRIDYIFITAPLKAASYKIIFDGVAGPIVSDHYGVEAEIYC